jgi:hypothetical protein
MNDVFKLAATIKTHEAKWPLEFINGKYDCAGDSQQQL